MKVLELVWQAFTDCPPTLFPILQRNTLWDEGRSFPYPLPSSSLTEVCWFPAYRPLSRTPGQQLSPNVTFERSGSSLNHLERLPRRLLPRSRVLADPGRQAWLKWKAFEIANNAVRDRDP